MGRQCWGSSDSGHTPDTTMGKDFNNPGKKSRNQSRRQSGAPPQQGRRKSNAEYAPRPLPGSRRPSQGGFLPGAANDWEDDLPAHYDPARGGYDAPYDVEAGYREPQHVGASGVRAEQAYRPDGDHRVSNARNESWAGEERDPHFRAMDLMGSDAMNARGRGALAKETHISEKSERERRKSERLAAEKAQAAAEAASNVDYDKQQEIKYYRRRFVDHVALVVYIAFGAAELSVGLLTRDEACNDLVETIMIAMG